MVSPEQEYMNLYEQMFTLCRQNNWGDPFSGNRSKEIHMAGVLNHRVSTEIHGPDAFDEDGPCEYKSCVHPKNVVGFYNGFSLCYSWDETLEKVSEKIRSCHNHYFGRYYGSELVEVWRMRANDVLTSIAPRLFEKFRKVKDLKDPRMRGCVYHGDMKKYGERLI